MSDGEGARFARQIALVEIGIDGQRAIAGATAHVGAAGLAGLYATRAGFLQVVEDATPESVPAWVEAPSARELIAGSLSALRAIRVAIGRESPDAR